jgi:chromate reductase, NAD(P)H dehydrogenase (quinone)
MSILIFNGSPNGKKSNCHVLIQKLAIKMKAFPEWQKKQSFEIVNLADLKWSAANIKKLTSKMEAAEGFIFVTGTYWDSWGSPLQSYLENITHLEGSKAFMGKPAVVLVLNHSVGGKGVLSRLQGVLSTLGCLIPPMSGMVYSWVSDNLAINSATKAARNDLWSLDDLAPILENFHKTLQLKITWTPWPVDRADYRKVWLR